MDEMQILIVNLSKMLCYCAYAELLYDVHRVWITAKKQFIAPVRVAIYILAFVSLLLFELEYRVPGFL